MRPQMLLSAPPGTCWAPCPSAFRLGLSYPSHPCPVPGASVPWFCGWESGPRILQVGGGLEFLAVGGCDALPWLMITLCVKSAGE